MKRLPYKYFISLLAFFSGWMVANAQTTPEPPCAKAKIAHVAKDFSIKLTASLESLEALATLEANHLEDLLESKLGTLDVLLDGPGPILIIDDQPGQEATSFAEEKVKHINRTFKVSNSDKLHIENQFGNVLVETWNRNEIAVEVSIISRAETEAKAQEILDKISVTEGKSGSLVSFVTELQPMQIKGSSFKSFEVNYIVKMPKSNPLSVSHRFGNVRLPSLDGATDITIRHGHLAAGRLSNRANEINIEHSKGECVIDYLKTGNLKIRHASMRVVDADDLNLNSAHSRITLGKVETLNVNSQHDPIFKIGSVNQVTGKGSFTVFKFDNLTGFAVLELRHGPKFEIASIDHNFKKIDINSEFTAINLNFADRSAFNFNVNTAHSSGLKANPNLVNLSFKEVKNTSAVYKGNYGTATGKGMVTVTSRHGSVIFN